MRLWGARKHGTQHDYRILSETISVHSSSTELLNRVPKTTRQDRPRDSVILCSHFLPRPSNSRNKSVRQSHSTTFWRGVAGESHPFKGTVAPTLSALNGGLALQVASWKVSPYREVSQLHFRLLRYSGPLSRAGLTENNFGNSKVRFSNRAVRNGTHKPTENGPLEIKSPMELAVVTRGGGATRTEVGGG